MTDPARYPQSEEVPFDVVYREQFNYVWKLVQRYGVPARHLEDVVHDVFVLVHGNLASYDTSRPIKPWLAGFCFRVSQNFLRKAVQRREILDDPPEPLPTLTTPELELNKKQAYQLAQRALLAIDEHRRPVFILHEFEQMSIPEIADACNIPVNTAYSRLRLARAEFDRAIQTSERSTP